jgi:hypothetical protein
MITLGQFTRRKSCLDATPKFILNSKSRHGMRSLVSMQRVLSRSIVKTHGIVVKERTSTDS